MPNHNKTGMLTKYLRIYHIAIGTVMWQHGYALFMQQPLKKQFIGRHYCPYPIPNIDITEYIFIIKHFIHTRFSISQTITVFHLDLQRVILNVSDVYSSMVMIHKCFLSFLPPLFHSEWYDCIRTRVLKNFGRINPAKCGHYWYLCTSVSALKDGNIINGCSHAISIFVIDLLE